MDNLPSDPDILLSVLNMKLRDSYSSVSEMCDDLGWDYDEFMHLLHHSGIEYFPEGSRFVRI